MKNNSPEYREAIIAAMKEAIGGVSTTNSDEVVLSSGRLVGALLKRGLRIYPIEFGYPHEQT